MSQAVKLINWQRPMIKVLIGTIPLNLAAVYFFGWRVLVLLAVTNTAGFFTEYAFTYRQGVPVTSAVFVSATLFAMSVTPVLPLWMAVVGIVFAIIFGKMVFGGFGRNIFNPALTGRAFIYVCFGAYMTAQWYDPVPGAMGGLMTYTPDAITGATPGMHLKTGATFALADLFFGRAAGTIGGTCALLALLGGIYLVVTRAANYRIPVAGIIGFLAVQTGLWLWGKPPMADPVHAMLAGSFLVGIFFYATDPVSAAQTDSGRWLYGAFVGVMSSLISAFSAWPAGTMFAILLGNMFAPITDHVIRQWRADRQVAQVTTPTPPGGAA